MIMVQHEKDCCGCNACGDICPEGAISYTVNKEGFWYPNINENKCTNCGLCKNICPALVKNPKIIDNYEKPDCYVAEHKSTGVLFSSTSGGIFSALADAMYNQKGYVGGAIHNQDFSVSHFISNKKIDLQKLRRSKDLQSNAEGFYKKVKDILDRNDKVLVCGLPCQIAALINYLGRDYDNLITVDLICAGVNSPKVWRKYLDYIEEINKSKIVWTENKSKEYGWKNLTQKFVFEDGNEYFDTYKTSPFIQGYIGSHLYVRPSCYDCKFKGFPRQADITLGDFWGIENYTDKYNSDMGTSLVFVNSEKGKKYFEKASKRINYEKTKLEWAISGNPAINNSITVISNDRDSFFEELDNYRFDELINKYSINNRKKKKKLFSKLRGSIAFGKYIVKVTRFNPVAVFQTIKYSGLKNLIRKKGIICGTNCHINIDKTVKLEFDGLLTLGRKEKFKKSKAESRLYLGKNAIFKVLGNFEIDADSEIIVFDKGELIIHGSKNSYSDANEGLRIVCGAKVEIMHDVGIGRNVVIRDTNGEHYINTVGYNNKRPVIIGEKAWLCESSTIMPGVNIGRGTIVSAYSLVSKSTPDHVLVSGIPAKVVQENVLWKL